MLKVVPKKSSGWQDFKTVCLGISMHTANHTGDALEGMLNWANNNFQDIILDVSDTLHRHNYIAQGNMPETARRKARKDGDDWLAQNRKYIDALSVPVQIVRWDRWLSHPHYPDVLNAFKKAFSSQPQFHNVVINDVMGFHKRTGSTNQVDVSDHVLDCGVAYLLEEIAVHSVMYAETPCAILYPGKQHSCYKLVREGKVQHVSDGLKNSFFTRMIVYNFDEFSTTLNSETVNNAA